MERWRGVACCTCLLRPCSTSTFSTSGRLTVAGGSSKPASSCGTAQRRNTFKPQDDEKANTDFLNRLSRSALTHEAARSEEFERELYRPSKKALSRAELKIGPMRVLTRSGKVVPKS